MVLSGIYPGSPHSKEVDENSRRFAVFRAVNGERTKAQSQASVTLT